MSEIPADLPNLDSTLFQRPDPPRCSPARATHPPRFLLLYGSCASARTAAWPPRKPRA